jgi:hypothetical protein
MVALPTLTETRDSRSTLLSEERAKIEPGGRSCSILLGLYDFQRVVKYEEIAQHEYGVRVRILSS